MPSSSSAAVAPKEANTAEAVVEVPEAEAPVAASAAEVVADGAPAAAAGRRPDMEASTSASDEDDGANALKEAAASSASQSNFKFNSTAAEFVMPKATPFQFNAGASEFTFNPAAMTFAMPDLREAPQSSAAAGPTGATFLHPVPVTVHPNVPVYPVVAVHTSNRQFAYVTGGNGVMPVSPTGAAQAVRFGHLPSVPYTGDSHSYSTGTEPRKGGGKGQKNWQGKGEGKGRGQQEQKGQAQPPPVPEPKEFVNDMLPEESKEENKEEGDEDKKDKKPSWADMARKNKEKPKAAEPLELTRSLPKRVQAKARGAPPVTAPATSTLAAPAAASAPPSATAAVAKAAAAASPIASPAVCPIKEPTEPTELSLEAPAVELTGLDEATNVASKPDSVLLEATASSESKAADADADADAADETAESTDKPKEKGPPSWADRIKASAATAQLARPKKGIPAKSVGIPAQPLRAPWAKAPPASPAAAEAPAAAGPADSDAKDAWEGTPEKPDTAAEAVAEAEESEPTGSAQVEGKDKEEASAEDEQEEEAPAAVVVAKAEATPNEADEDEDEEEEDDADEAAESASTAEWNDDKSAPAKVVDGPVHSASEKLASEIGKPDANGIIRYSVSWLMSMAEAPASQGTCPPNIPACLRSSEDAEAIEKDMQPEDRKRYKLAFLKQFKEKAACQELPANHKIPKDIRASAGSPTRTGDKAESGNKEDDWRADAGQHQQRMRDGKDKGNRDRKTGGRTIERRQEETLVVGENSWAQQQQALKQESDVKVIREMKSILNKLTVEKFDTLYQKLLECGIETQEHIEKFMGEVFEKATTQHHFISMYTELCIKLNSWLLEKGIKDAEGKAVVFKRILLNQCQDSFEKYLKPPEGLDNLEGEPLVEARLKYKTKMLGNMKFVGELLIHKVLSSKIIFSCAYALLDSPSEEKLETLCAFLNTIGPAYDVKEWKSYDELSRIFAEVKALSVNPKDEAHTPPRIKFLLKDVVELRQSGWDRATKITSAPKGPMKMADVQKQWAKDNALTDSRSGKGGGKGAPAPLQEPADDEWATVGKARQGAFKQGASTTPSSKSGGPSLSTPSGQVRPATTMAGGSSNTFGLLESPSRGKDKKKKDDIWRRAEKIESEPKAWKPREKTEKPELGRSVSSVSAGASTSNAEEERELSAKEFQAEVQGALKELVASHDASEALTRVETLKVPARHQKAVLVHIFAYMSEQGESARSCLLTFVLRLFGTEESRKEVFPKKALLEGLEGFISESYLDCKCDVPKLPSILKEEFLPALGKGALSEEEIKALEASIDKADASEEA